jgi:hypothetical protein
MIAYHGTTKEKVMKIVKEGFSLEFQGENGSHFGKGIYLASTKKRAKAYGNCVLTVEFDESRMARLYGWLKEYTQKCQEVYEAGTPAEQVNTVVGEYYKELYTSKGYTGIIMDSVIGTAKEMVIYDTSVIKNIRLEF